MNLDESEAFLDETTKNKSGCPNIDYSLTTENIPRVATSINKSEVSPTVIWGSTAFDPLLPHLQHKSEALEEKRGFIQD